MPDGLHTDNEGNKSWWLNDELHREDGPAVEWVNGHKSWWYLGYKIPKPKTEKERKFHYHSCPGTNGEECANKNWIPRGATCCIICKPVPEPLEQPERKIDRRRAKKEPPQVNVEKLTAYLEKCGVRKINKEGTAVMEKIYIR